MADNLTYQEVFDLYGKHGLCAVVRQQISNIFEGDENTLYLCEVLSNAINSKFHNLDSSSRLDGERVRHIVRSSLLL